VGRPSVGHATATGKVLLAFGNAVLPPGQLRAYTPRTITDRREFEAEVERVRRRGHADALGEREPDLNAIAAPVFSGRGDLTAIVGVQGPSSRFGREAMRAAVEPLRVRAAAVSRALGRIDPERG
jgi:DNA-binding IclR family transcriptional regulator